MDQGYVHIYTGDGKGKTTAAFGLAVRALCAGKSVYVGQFVKSMKYHETRIEELFASARESFGRIRIEQLGRGCFIDKNPEAVDVEMAHEGLRRCADYMRSGEYDVVILTVAEVLDVVAQRDPHTEIVITGRKAPQALIDAADLVTEMKEIKHYYHKGVMSRDGIER